MSGVEPEQTGGAVVETPEEGLRSRFSLIPADSENVQNEVFRLRHQIFCEEFRLFEPRPDGMERDDFDRHSLFLLLRSARTAEAVGCVTGGADRPVVPLLVAPIRESMRLHVGTHHPRSWATASKLDRRSLQTWRRSKISPKKRRTEIACTALGRIPQAGPSCTESTPVSLHLGVAVLGFNCIGRILVDQYAVHLHRTPSSDTFRQTRRAHSPHQQPGRSQRHSPSMRS